MMRLRIGAVSVLFGIVTTGMTWLSLARFLAALLEFASKNGEAGSLLALRVQALMPFVLSMNVIASTLLCSVLLYFVVVRPLSSTEETIDKISQNHLNIDIGGGGLFTSRIRNALQRMTDALLRVEETNARQLKDLRESNEKLKLAQTELVAQERLASVGRLAAGVAHEVGNPLSGILGYLSVLEMRSEEDKESKDILARVESEVMRIDRIVRSLLDLGRPIQGVFQPVELTALVQAAVALVSKGHDFEKVKVSFDAPNHVWASAEPGPVSQILINLLINAAHAAQGQKQVWVKVRAGETSAHIEVHDSGNGLSDEVLQRIGEPFFTTKEAGKGTGLGLAVCFHLVSKMKGDLKAMNHPDGGAVFTLRLPLAKEGRLANVS